MTTTTDLIDISRDSQSRGLPRLRPQVDERLLDVAYNVTRTNVIAVIGPQGGAGKTRITFALGSALASLAGLNVISVDLEDDYDALITLVPDQTRATQTIERVMEDEEEKRIPWPALRRCCATTRSRMLVLRGPEEEVTLDEMLVRLGNAEVVILDCAAGLHGARVRWAMEHADQVIVVAAPRPKEAASVAFTTQQALSEFGVDGTLVINKGRGRDVQDVEQAFVTVSGLSSTTHIPESQRFAKGMASQRYQIEDLDRATRMAVRELATRVGERLR